jgi:acyl-CoA thioesterase I
MQRRLAALAVILFCAGLAGSAPSEDGRKTLLFFGDSLTAGYGVGKELSYPSVLQARIDSLGWEFEVVNAGLSGETSAAGLRRIDWILRRPIDLFVLELGGNDGLRGIPLEYTKKTLQQILDRVRKRNPETILVVAGMQLPPNLGPHYIEEFRAIFPRLAKNNEAHLIPFLLEGVGGEPKLMLPDGIHPTADGHRAVAELVWRQLEPVLKSLRTQASVRPTQNLEGRSGVDAAAADDADQNGDRGETDQGQP